MLRLAEGQPLALAYLDLDRFKLINDLYGVTSVTRCCSMCAAGQQRVVGQHAHGSLGGDEFLLVLPDTKIELAC